MSNIKRELEKIMPKKTHCPSDEYDVGRNRGINGSLTALSEKLAGVEEMQKVFDKFYQIPTGKTTMGVMMNMGLRNKIILALQSKFIVLRKGCGK